MTQKFTLGDGTGSTMVDLTMNPIGSGEIAITRFGRTVRFSWTSGALKTAESWSDPPASKPPGSTAPEVERPRPTT